MVGVVRGVVLMMRYLRLNDEFDSLPQGKRYETWDSSESC